MKKWLGLLLVLAVVVLPFTRARAVTPVFGKGYNTWADSLYNSVLATTGVAFVDSLIADTCAVGFADSSRIVDGRGFDDIEVEVFCWPVADSCTNAWTRYAIEFRNHLVPASRIKGPTVPDSLNTSVTLFNVLADKSSLGTLTGDSLAYGNPIIDYRNGAVRNGWTVVTQTDASKALSARFNGHNAVSIKLRRGDTTPLRYWSISIHPIQQSCIHSSHPAPRFYVRAFMYRRGDRSR